MGHGVETEKQITTKKDPRIPIKLALMISCLHLASSILITASSTQGRPRIGEGAIVTVYFIKRLLLLRKIVGQAMATWKIQDA